MHNVTKDGFNWVKNTSQCNKDFIENCYITLQWFTIFAWKNENWKRLKTCGQFTQQKRICHKHKKFKTSTKLWISTEKSAWSNQTQQKSLAKMIL